MTAIMSTRPLSRRLCHRRLGHISQDRLTKMQQLTNGIRLTCASDSILSHCPSCAITKSVRFASGNKTTSRDYLPFEKVGVDIWSHSTPSIRRFLHLIGFTCYRTGYLVLYLMHTKDESVQKADMFLRWTMSQNRHVHFMRCDPDPIFKGRKQILPLQLPIMSSCHTPPPTHLPKIRWQNVDGVQLHQQP